MEDTQVFHGGKKQPPDEMEDGQGDRGGCVQ